MARAHTKAVATDTFTGAPAVDAKLNSSADWTDVYIVTATYEWYGVSSIGGATSDMIEYRKPGSASRRAVTAFTKTAPTSANYTVWGKYGGEANKDIDFYAAIVGRVTDAGANWDGYALLYRWVSGVGSIGIYRYVNNAATLISGSVAVTLVAGDEVALEVVGTGATVTLKGYLNDAEIASAADSSASRIVATGQPGVMATGASVAGNPRPRWTEWRLYELLTGVPKHMQHYRRLRQ